jgi:hypothetical protein
VNSLSSIIPARIAPLHLAEEREDAAHTPLDSLQRAPQASTAPSRQLPYLRHKGTLAPDFNFKMQKSIAALYHVRLTRHCGSIL